MFVEGAGFTLINTQHYCKLGDGLMFLSLHTCLPVMGGGMAGRNPRHLQTK